MQKYSRNEKQDAWWHRVICKREMTLGGKKEICRAAIPTLGSYVRNSRNKVKSYIMNKTGEASLLGCEILSRREQRQI